MDIDEEEINPMDLLSTELCTNIEDPLLTYANNEDDNDVEEIIAAPEIIDIDDETDAPNAVNGFSHEPESSAITLRPGQLPDDYTEAERAIYPSMFGLGNQAVQFLRLHCTACNTHLGSAPNDQTQRYIHPLLKVLICKSCFDFYGSGDFDKDEDGSELYCRWCGQGGKVLCCAQCQYVFCQRCIRANLGKKGLEMVKASDDWLCFVCNPNQIVKLRITCRALYEYVLKEIKSCEEMGQMQFLELDKSLCCKPKSNPKRKSGDAAYMPYDNDGRKKKKQRVAAISATANENMNTNAVVTWNDSAEDEVVCTPDLLMLMESEESASHSLGTNSQLDCTIGALSLPAVTVPNVNDNDIQFVSQTNAVHYSILNKTVTSTNNIQHNATVRENNSKQAKKKKSTLKSILSKKILAKEKATFGVLLPGVKYDWFEKATDAATKINENFSNKLSALIEEQANVESLERLAQIHNDFQELLSSFSGSLMALQKELRTNFIAGLQKLQFADPTPQVVESSDNLIDNDVIDLDAPSNDIEVPPPQPTILKVTHGYIKVKPVSELLASSVIMIPDDNTTSVAPITYPPAKKKITSKKQNNSKPVSEGVTDVSNVLNPGAVSLIKRALTESNLEKSLNENLTVNTNISPELLKKMTSVRVLLAKDYDKSTIHSHPVKDYSPMKIAKPINDQIVEIEDDVENVDSADTFVNQAKQSSSDDVELVQLDDPLALDYGLISDDGSLNNGLTNNQESIIVA